MINQIICVNNTYTDNHIVEGLTLHKVYNVKKFDNNLNDVVYIINDLDNYEGYYMDDFFITIDNWREQQLKKLI